MVLRDLELGRAGGRRGGGVLFEINLLFYKYLAKVEIVRRTQRPLNLPMIKMIIIITFFGGEFFNC